jgi:hypothetical protein
MDNLIISHTERFDVDIPVRIWINPEYEHLGYYEQIGGHTFGEYWDEKLTYISTSYDKNTLQEDIEEEIIEVT